MFVKRFFKSSMAEFLVYGLPWLVIVAKPDQMPADDPRPVHTRLTVKHVWDKMGAGHYLLFCGKE